MSSTRTVRVPPEMEGPFADAEKIVSRYFNDRRDDPQHGTIEIFGERYVLMRAASLSVEFFSLVTELYGEGREAEADEFARNILFDLAHAVGKRDAQNFHAKMGLVNPIEQLSAGPVHFSHTGWAFVDISAQSNPAPNEDFFLLYDHPYSFESDAWLRAGQTRELPACIMNAGYSSGWCEASFGLELVATEVLCRARGDEACRFVMAPPSRIEQAVSRWQKAHDTAPATAQSRAYQIPDFFARKRMEEELRKTRDELEVRVVERTAALKHEIEERRTMEMKLLQAQKLEAVGRLAGGIAHDFNNLLAIMIGNAGLVAKRVDDETTRTLANEIIGAARRASALTQQLLTFSRSQAIERDTLEVNTVVTELGRMLYRVIGEEIDLRLQLFPDAGHVEADKGQLEQVLMNLVVNARDAMPQGGTLTIETGRVDAAERITTATGGLPPGAYVTIAVTDTGMGMDPDTVARAFEPFFTTKQADKGTGLGLSTVYGIVTKAGGGIIVTTSPDKGARFLIHLPRAAPPDEEAAASARTPVHGGTETILLVEDQRSLRLVFSRVLADEGYTVIEASDGPEALRLAAAHSGAIHIVVTDVIMPRMRGPELAARLRTTRPDIKVLYVSGFANDTSLGEEIAGGKAILLAKPFEPEVLVRKVRDLLDKRS